MSLNTDQHKILEAAASAVKTAWREQWMMIEEEDKTIAAEYLMTTSVARSLSALAGGRVRIERLIGCAFRNMVMRRHCSTPIPSAYGQGRIDVMVTEDSYGFLPYCLIELKREFSRSAIEHDADRIAVLIEHTVPKLPDIFGFCLFPLILSADATSPCNYVSSRKTERGKVNLLVGALANAHPTLLINERYFSEFSVNRPSVVTEFYDDGTEESIWDNTGFQMEPAVIIIQKRTNMGSGTPSA